MIYVEAPTPYQPAPGDGPSLFLAGGITACPDWQSDARALLTDAPIVVLKWRPPRWCSTGLVTGASRCGAAIA